MEDIYETDIDVAMIGRLFFRTMKELSIAAYARSASAPTKPEVTPC